MELWTAEHRNTLLPAIIIMCLIGWLLRHFLGNKEYKIRLIPVQILTCMLLVLEIGKQGLSFARGYDLYHIPLHFCSLYLLVLPMLSFYRGKHTNAVRAVSAALCGALFLLMLIYPNLIYSAGNIQNFFTDYFSFHTVAFHNIVMLVFVLILALDLHTPSKKKEWVACIWFTAGFCVVSSVMAQVLKTNFANYYQCNIPPLEALRVQVQSILGVVPTQILYILVVSALNIAFVLMSYWVYRGVRGLLYKLSHSQNAAIR